MKVAVLFDNYGPYHLARATATSELADVLAVEFGGTSREYAWERPEAVGTLQKVTLFSDRSSREVSIKEFQTRLSEVLDSFRPEAVAIPGWSGRGAFLALSWCLLNRVSAIVMSESTAYDEVRSGWREWIKKRYVGLCSAALVGGSPHQEYMQQLGMLPERIFQGYDAVDNRYFSEKAAETRNSKAETRREGDLPENYFLASARFIEKKNLTRLIDAYALYRERSKKLEIRNLKPEVWDLVMLGDGELRESLEAQVSSLNLSDHVQMPGFKQYLELPAYFGLAGAFIHASTSEQWGLVVNEAMASGLPVLVSNRCGCAPDLVEEGLNGYTYDPNNVEQLANLMFELSTKDSHLLTLGSASQRIISQWGPERFASGLLAAAEKATTLPLPKPGWLDRVLLNLLAKR